MARDHRSDPGTGSGPQRYPGTFLLAFREAAAALDWKVARWLGTAVECLDSSGKEHTVGLENLYRVARREDRAEWPELIREFLGRVAQQHDLGELPDTLDEVGERLLVRVGRPFSPQTEGPAVWAAPAGDTGLTFNLVIDSPHTMAYVTAEMVERSGGTADDWLEMALANLRQRTPPGCMQVAHPESGLHQCTVGDAYDSSRALLLDELLPDGAEAGWFVALPGRDDLLVLPVTAATLPYVPMLRAVAERGYRSAPYAITEQVIWIHGGRWRLFPIHIRGEEVTVMPPPEFADVLERLGGPALEGDE